MRNFNLLFLVLILLSGCGLFKKVEKDKSVVEKQTLERKEIETDNKIVDKTVKTEIIAVDTTLKTKPAEVKQETPKPNNLEEALKKGLQVMSNDLVDVTIQLDSASNTLRTTTNVKSRDIDFDYNKTTRTENDITTDQKKKEAILNKSNEKEERKKKVEEPKNSFWLIIGGAIALIIALFFGSKALQKK